MHLLDGTQHVYVASSMTWAVFQHGSLGIVRFFSMDIQGSRGECPENQALASEVMHCHFHCNLVPRRLAQIHIQVRQQLLCGSFPWFPWSYGSLGPRGLCSSHGSHGPCSFCGSNGLCGLMVPVVPLVSMVPMVLVVPMVSVVPVLEAQPDPG